MKRVCLALLFLLAPTTIAFAAPNIVVVMTDDQEDTGSMAYMPKVRSLIAEQGITFQNSFANVPLCAPSRASFFTGEAAHNHGIRANSPLDNGGWETFKTKEETALPVWLQQAGYKTALIGKYLNRYGQQSIWGAWLAWIGNLFGIEFKGETVGNPRDWVPKGWDLWYAFTGSARPLLRLCDQRERHDPRFRRRAGGLLDRRSPGARGALHPRPEGRDASRSFCTSRRRQHTRKARAPSPRRDTRNPSRM